MENKTDATTTKEELPGDAKEEGASQGEVGTKKDAPAAAADAGAKRSYLDWAARSQIPAWKAEAARQGEGWVEGFEVTEAEFIKALDRAFNTRIG